MPSAIIRERTPADLPAAADALIEIHRTDGYPVEGVADPIAWLTGPTLLRAWVAELAGCIVGHVAISEPGTDDAAPRIWREQSGETTPTLVLGRLFVLPDARGHAVGRRLLEAARDESRTRGTRLTLDVMAKDTAAIALYERLGWRRTGETRHDDGTGHGHPALAYVSPP
jgi:GNAT superfamily N-acetyltransferase